MSTAENAKLQYEAGQTATAMSALSTSEGLTYTSGASLWSKKSGYAPVVRPNGLLTGGAVTPGSSNNVVNVAALTLNLNGVVTSVNAGTATITRPSTAVSKVCSITINNSGSIAVVAGTDGSTTAFSETRAAAGGPPLIPTTSVEIAQVRVTTNTAGLIASAEIFQTIGVHQEYASYPPYEIDHRNGQVVYSAANASIHTGPVPRAVFASYAVPIFSDVPRASDVVLPETTYSLTSTQVYGGTIGSSSRTLNQGSFTAYLDDGITDPLVGQKGFNLWFRFYPDRYKSSYALAQGILGISRTFPVADTVQAACTINAEAAAVEVA